MYVIAEVYETDIGRIHSGQKTTISGELLPEKLTGTVTQIDAQVSKSELLPLEPSAFADTRVFKVKIQLDNSERAAALIYGKVDAGDFIDEHVKDPLVQELMSRTRHTPEATFLVVTLKNGARFEETLQSASDLKGWDTVKEKFKRCIYGIMTDDDAEKIPTLVSRMESLSLIRLLTKSLRTNRT